MKSIGLHKEVKLQEKRIQEVSATLQGKITPNAGHCLWEVNKETGEIKKATFQKMTVAFGSKTSEKRLSINDNFVYIPALNAKNAEKKYNKNSNQSDYYDEAPCLS